MNTKVKKVVVASSLVMSGVLAGAVLATASNGIQKIQAALNTNIKFKVDGGNWTPKDNNGNRQYALVYNGTTYLPLRSTAEALGASVALNPSTQVIDINSGSGSNNTSNDTSGIPYNDVNTSSPSTNNSNTGSSANSSSSSSTGILKLTGTDSQMAEALRPEALELTKAYIETLKNGSTAKFEAYVKAHVSGTIDNSPINRDHAYWVKQYKEDVASAVSYSNAAKISKYVEALSSVTLSNISYAYAGDRDEYGQYIALFVKPDGYGSFSYTTITFKFSVDKYGSSNYILSGITIN